LKLEELCRQYEGEGGWNCWRALAFIYVPLSKNNPEEAFKLCHRTDDQSAALGCYTNAVNLMILSKGYSDKDIADTCRYYFADSKGEKDCIITALSALLGSSTDFMDRATSFCNAQPQEYQGFCYDIIGQEIGPRTTPEKRESLCKDVPKQYYPSCISSQSI